jgi:uncharacterized protein (DUF58 family)
VKLPPRIERAVRAAGFFLTGRAALVLALGAPVVAVLRGAAAMWIAALWAAAWVALVVSDVLRAPHPNRLQWSRTLPPKLSIGVANPATIRIGNPSGHVVTLTGRETPPALFAGERRFGPVSVEPHGEAAVELSFTPPKRGRYEFGDIGTRTAGPLGLAGRAVRVPLTQEVKVYPDIVAVRSYALLARKGALAEMGIKRMRLAGEGTEFESLRDYLDGDSFRDIDWKATARRGKPIVRTFEVERSQTLMIAIDAGRLMTPQVGALSKLDRAVNAALMLAYLGTERDDMVGLLVFGRDVERYLPPRKGHRQFLAILEALYAVEGRVEEPDYDRAIRYLATRLPKRALVAVFTDLQGKESSHRLLSTLSAMAPRHLPLVITQRNRDVERTSRQDTGGEQAVFEAAVAESLLSDKAAALKTLQARGVLVLDVHPEELTVASVNRYLEIKARGRL